MSTSVLQKTAAAAMPMICAGHPYLWGHAERRDISGRQCRRILPEHRERIRPTAAKPSTAQQKDRPLRQQNPALYHGTAGIAPPTAISPDKQGNKPAQASSRDEGIGMVELTPENIRDQKGGGDDGRAEE